MATADHVLQQQKGIKESFDNAAKVGLDKWLNAPYLNVQSTTEFTEIFTSTEGFSGTKKLTEHEQAPVNALGDGYSVTFSQERFGNGYEITSTDMLRMGDSTTKVKDFLSRQRNNCLYDVNDFFVDEMHKFFNYAFATTYFAAPDTKAFIADDHAWASGQTFDNKGTAALSMAAWQAARLQGTQVKDGAGKEMGVSYNTVVVMESSDAAVEAIKLFASGIQPTSIADVNIYKGSVTIIETPRIEYANRNYWFAYDNKRPDQNPLYVGIGKYPSFSEPLPQKNNAVWQDVEGFFMQGIANMPWQWFGSPGTA